jgi:hypothetical protein
MMFFRDVEKMHCIFARVHLVAKYCVKSPFPLHPNASYIICGMNLSANKPFTHTYTQTHRRVTCHKRATYRCGQEIIQLKLANDQ